MDLLVTTITLSPAMHVANGTFNAAVTVKNQGNAAISGAFLDVWANRATAATCDTEGDAWIDVGAVGIGASKVLTLTGLNAGTAGSKTLRAFIDSWCETVESNETNNQMIKAYTVQ
jgi:subtilase family serine protease